ncbi:hypothetical protein [Streptomyces sp. NL15-2K]|uniref:hypothetical protein n=1 Tax=Streptomyces sp. NL15-2K TaxID=376149 RepID=UPI000F5677D1|nr:MULTISPECIES: hypothetical protein [Actinomycetes]WKX09593.1 hypothetical protein Q4V64_19710 [Kutzneria buriramensis]GCB48885.1 hypothetical protein SNL152K_6213 [Streptomyces sp. NL15-2K]
MRVKKGRKDAQPEWPEVAVEDRFATGEGTQAFPETIGSGIPRQATAEAGRTGISGSGDRDLPDADRPGGAGRADALASAGETGERPGAAVPTAAVRDPWKESDASGSGQNPHVGTGAAHDPDEVTVQLDDIGEQREDLLVRQAKGGGPDSGPGGGQDGSDGPVFVDESGRRSRRFRRIGMVVGLACAVYAVVIVATLLSGNSHAPWLPVPGQEEDRPAGKVETSPQPEESDPPSATGGVWPGPRPTVSEGTAPVPAPGASAPRATTRPDRPGTSPGPEASPTRTAPGPGTGPTEPTPTPSPTATITDPPVVPTPTDTAPTPTPTGTTGTGDSAGPGTGTVADGPNEPTPIATEPGTPAGPDPGPGPGPEPAPAPIA